MTSTPRPSVAARVAATKSVARAALDRILVDEVRHRDFGWACLDWVLTTPLAPALPVIAAAELPRLFARLTANYGGALDAPTAITDDDRAWGLAPARDYAQILAATWDRDYAPRFEARGIAAAAAWAARGRP